MDERMKELVAMGAAAAANCHPPGKDNFGFPYCHPGDGMQILHGAPTLK
jgi:hypothetical protein